MNDDQLRQELERRSSGAQLRADELLPGVRGRIGVRPQPARVARWAPVAGLAAAAVIVVALVIAFPGGAPSPGSKSLDVMTTDAFASALQRGSLAGQTVLVNGGIVPFDTAIGGALCEPPGLCPLGQIENVQPRLAVSAEQVAAAATDNAGDLGTSWTAFTLPIRGTLMLSVDESSGVQFLGRVVPNGDQLAWSAGQVKTQLDVNSQDLGDTVLVNGWLTGVDFPAPCPSFLPTFPGLPDRNECGVDTWIADDPAVLTTQTEHPVTGIEVQPPAFATYAPDPTARTGDDLRPQRAIYALAKRLYGQFCATESPCWDWYVVGRLSQPAPVLPPPPPSSNVTLETAPSTMRSTVPPSATGEVTSPVSVDCGAALDLADSTGTVVSCSDKGDGDYHSAKFGVAGDTDLHLIHLTWLEDCETSHRISVSSGMVGSLNGYVIKIAPTSFDASCWFEPDAHFADISFVQPIDPTAVSLDVGSGSITCEQSGNFAKHVGNVAIRDGTGLITSCTQVPSSVASDAPDTAVNVQPNQVRVDWTDYAGPAPELTLNELGGHYELAGGQTCNSCPYARFESVITFSNPIDASSIWLGLSGEPATPPTSVHTGNVPVANTDWERDFALTITSPKWVYTTNEAIDVQTELSYIGTDSLVVVSGPGSGLVVFGVTQVDGNLAVDGVWSADCKLGGYSLTPGNFMNVPFAKTGGYDANGLGADFNKNYFADPQLHLPPGRWQIYAAADFSVGSICSGNDVRMKAMIEIEVDADQQASPSPTPST